MTFGSLGWNVQYSFNESDLENSILMIQDMLNKSSGTVPWQAMHYMVGHINYGGRVTDVIDARLLNNLLNVYMTPDILNPEYVFSISGVYKVPLC